MGDVLYFVAKSGSVDELWQTDGTIDGTIPYLRGVQVSWVTAVGSVIYSCYDPDGSGFGLHTLDLTPSQLYYSNQWQVLESRRSSGAAIEQYVWSNAYVDAVVERDRNGDNDASTGNYGKTGSGLEQRMYALQDANWNTTAVVMLHDDGSVELADRIQYDPYGAPTFLYSDWTLDTNYPASVSSWTYLPQGGRYDPLTGLVDRRGRAFSTSLGRWIQQDPAGYADSSNLYQYTKSNPLAFTDPSGLESLSDQAWDLSDEVRADDLAAVTQIETAAHDGVSGVQRGANFAELLSDGLFGQDSPFGGIASAFQNTVSSVANWLNADTDSVFQSFVQGAWAGVLNVADDFSFQQSDTLHNLRNQAWDNTGLAGTWYETGSNAAAWTAVVAYNLATIVEAAGLDVEFNPGSTNCFLAGTPVLLGDRKTEEGIDQIHVGQRVATDGGVANSKDRKTAFADTSHTDVDQKTWQLVTIDAGDWEVKTLVPNSWISLHAVSPHHSLPMTDVVDLAEMGVPGDLAGEIQSIAPCPRISAGPGRVVLTTVTHLSNFIYSLTLKDAQGNVSSLGVTGYHRFFDEEFGWIKTSNLHIGEVLRGAHGPLYVDQVTRKSDVDRVYNMTVESDHVYYVGDLAALTHNNCTTNARALRANLIADGEEAFEGAEAAHIVPSGDRGGIVGRMQEILEDVDIDINDAENGFFAKNRAHEGTHTQAFLRWLHGNLEDAAGSYDDVVAILENAKYYAKSGAF